MDIWKHGTYIDTWSIVHLLSGFLLAGGFYGFNRNFTEALLLSILLLLLWELFEWKMGIIEPSVNVIMDILIGMAGFSAGAYGFYAAGIPLGYLYAACAGTAMLSLWGFIDFKRRGYR
jgi:hypothetical protein